ncbi:DoxX family protein [Roseateles toxinivorans]|uniref:Putative oxidoreductase n=1 Tax=Roseateles toxinivorans TaxID=270368 RepID=A0A4R6QKG9_9BURK|nr:DoxX family protein [Roseateles toxinivorans]TDP64246.1 putative oxidoreductase [Roseateles toxinivorans]
MTQPLQALNRLWAPIARLFDALAPLADLAMRVYLAKVFFLSGLTKIRDWDSTIGLFTDEYQVPLLPPALAALGGTGGELVLPVLLLLGLATRFSAAGLSVLNVVAVLSYYHVLKDAPAALEQHLVWGLMLAVMMVTRPSVLTLDHWWAKRLA